MKDGVGQTADGDAEIADNNGNDHFVDQEYSEDEDEDPEQVKVRIWPVARTAVAKAVRDGSSELLNLEFLAQGGFHHVWLVTFSTVSEIFSLINTLIY